jgi:hypothetical protein
MSPQEQPQHLDHLVALMKDLYLDFCKLTVRTRIAIAMS